MWTLKEREKKLPTWEKVDKGLELLFGWQLAEKSSDKRVYTKSRERLIAKRIVKNKLL